MHIVGSVLFSFQLFLVTCFWHNAGPEPEKNPFKSVRLAAILETPIFFAIFYEGSNRHARIRTVYQNDTFHNSHQQIKSNNKV